MHRFVNSTVFFFLLTEFKAHLGCDLEQFLVKYNPVVNLLTIYLTHI